MKTKSFFLIALMALSSLSISLFAQDDKINDIFSSKTSLTWKAGTKDATILVKDSKLVVTPVIQKDETYRGDITSVGDIALNIGKYPILAIKLQKVGESWIGFDTNMGGLSAKFTIIQDKDGFAIGYIDLTKITLKGLEGVTQFSTTEKTTFKKMTFKIGGYKFTPEQITNKQANFEIAWIKSFVSVDELKSLMSGHTTGCLNEEFSEKSPLNWKAGTKSASVKVKGAKLVVTPAIQKDSTFRGDLTLIGEATLNAGKYPILAIKYQRSKDSWISFDTNLGVFSGKFTKIGTSSSDGLDVYYTDLTKGNIGRGADAKQFSTTDPETFKRLNFKIGGYKFTPDQVANNLANYEVSWVKTFSSLDELKTFVGVK